VPGIAVPKVRKHDAPAWERLLRGLWLSGLRLGEAVALDWDSGPFVLDTTGKHPAFRIEAEGQKSRQSEIVPATPDFAEWVLAATPPEERQGTVFKLPVALHGVGVIVSKIGRKAGVIVGQTDKIVEQDGKRVREFFKLFAGAHDLRRAFCSRWARRVMPAVLQKLARHANISTTMGYYVFLTADEIGADLWASHRAAGNTLGNTRPKRGEHEESPRVTSDHRAWT
jgi:integrase